MIFLYFHQKVDENVTFLRKIEIFVEIYVKMINHDEMLGN